MLIKNFKLDLAKLVTNVDGKVPLVFWPITPNFGDLLSPWIFQKMTGREVRFIKSSVKPTRRQAPKLISEDRALRQMHYISIGSIISRARNTSIVWGTGSFGTEQFGQLSPKADYRAVRGPLTRQLLKNARISSPEVYGDPALLVPHFVTACPKKKHEIGLVFRWSEGSWIKKQFGDGIKIIDLGSQDVDQTLNDILSCEKIITSSLHGLIIADSFRIPNAFLGSDTPKGGLFKYFDYFASVDKFRLPSYYTFDETITNIGHLEKNFKFDDRPISFDRKSLLAACPFLTPSEGIVSQMA